MSIAEAKGGDGAAAGSADDVLPIVIIGGLTAAPERAPRGEPRQRVFTRSGNFVTVAVSTSIS